MPNLYTVAAGGLIASADIDQLVNTFNGTQNTPVSVKNNDPISYTLALQNLDPASKSLLVTAADGTTVLLRAQGAGVVASPDGTAAAPIVTTTHAQTLSNKTLSNVNISTGGIQVTAGNIAIGGTPSSNNGVLLASGYTLSATSGGAAGVSIISTLSATANNDSLYGVYSNPAYADTGHTGVQHYGMYSASGSNYFAGNVGAGVSPGALYRLLTQGSTSDSTTSALRTQNAAGTMILEARDDLWTFFANTAAYVNNLGDVKGRYLSTTDGFNGVVGALNGSLYLRSSGANNSVVMDSGTGGLLVSSGALQVPNSSISAGPILSGAAGDMSANRNNGTGYVWLANASHYIGYDGSNYQLPTSNLFIAGDRAVTENAVETLSNKSLNDPRIPSGWWIQSAGSYTLPSVVGAAGQIRLIKAWGANTTIGVTNGTFIIG